MITITQTVAPRYREIDYTEALAERLSGLVNLTTDFGYCDVVTRTHAWEVKYAKGWRHAFGQALTYGLELDRQPGVCIIDPPDGPWRQMVIRVATHFKIDLVVFDDHRYDEWIMTPNLPRHRQPAVLLK